MTINNAANKVIALGDGSTTVFNFSFVGDQPGYISVIYTDTSGNETTLTQGSGPTQYQLSLNSAVSPGLWGIGGTVTYAPSSTPIAVGTSLTIIRTLPLVQNVSLLNLSSLAAVAEATETGLDQLEMQLQQTDENVSRVVAGPVSDPAGLNYTLPAVAQRANTGLAFDSHGNVIAGVLPTSGVISSAMQPVVDATSLAAGRTAFGLGTMAQEGIGAGLQDDGSGNARVIFSISQIAANQSIGASSHLIKYIAGAALTLTLARANTLWSGFGFWVDASGGAVTLSPNASDTIAAQQNASGTAVTIPQGAVAYITTNAASSGTWWVEWLSNNAGPVAGGSVRGLSITNNASSPNDHINVSASEIVIPNAVGGAVRLLSFSTVINVTTVGLNGLDTGSLGSSATWVYIYAISNGTASGAIASLSSSSPTLPSGYTFVKYIGAMRWNGSGSSGFLRTLQSGRRTRYVLTPSSNTSATPIMVQGNTSNTITAVATGNFVPTTASIITVVSAVSGGAVIVAPNGSYQTNVLGSGSQAPIFASTSGPDARTADILLESTNIYWASTVSGAGVYCAGWEDNQV